MNAHPTAQMLSDAPLICFLMIQLVNTVAPAAVVPISSFFDIPTTSFSCNSQLQPGIYADVETGCQVFHFCQEGGRNNSFFCPHFTVFNQQFFICDWRYNVDCSMAPSYFSLNTNLYKTPEIIQQAIQPAHQILKQDKLQISASNKHFTSNADLIIPAQNSIISRPKQKNASQASLKSGEFIASSPFNNIKKPENYNTYGVYDAADPEPIAKVVLKGDTYGGNDAIDISDPEPTASSYKSGAQVYSQVIDTSDPEPTAQAYLKNLQGNAVVSGVASSKPLVQTYAGITDAADPEPSAVNYLAYPSGTDAADPEPYAYNSGYTTGSDAADPEPTAGKYLAYPSGTDAADPEPYAKAYQSGAYTGDSSDPEPSAITFASQSYQVANANSKPISSYTDTSDPEPISYYGSYDAADPEPAAVLSQTNIQQTTYDDTPADPEPDTTYGGYYSDLSADPEPTSR